MDDRMRHDDTICRTNMMLEYRQVLNTVCKYLGLTSGYGLPAPDYMIYGELEKRLMPEGCEWPTVDGRKIDFKTPYQPSLGVLEAVSIYSNGACEVMSHDGIIKPVSEILVGGLAADGKPLEAGQTVYAKNYGYVKCTVLSFEWVVDGWLVEVENENGHKFRQTPDAFTHQRPALDIDHMVIKDGDTVWDVETGHEYKVDKVDGCIITIDGNDYSSMDNGAYYLRMYPSYHTIKFTHIKPEELDTWEHIEADCSKSDVEYCEEHGLLDPSCNTDEGEAAERHCIDCGCTCGEKMARDLVRRCKALSKRSE